MLRRTIGRVAPRVATVSRSAVSAAPSASIFTASRALRSASEESAPAASAEVTAIVDNIMKLNIMQSLELVKVLKNKFGYSDAAFMAAPAAAAPAAAAAAAPAAEAAKPAAAAKTIFTLKLESFDAKDKVKVIKEVRVITGKGLKEAKELVESAPQVLKADIKKDEADKLIQVLKEAGAVCSLE